jgi:uncharacterized protein YcbK (DUF882 family)
MRMQLRRRDLLLATGLTLVFGSSASARILTDSDPYVFKPLSTPRRLILRHAHTGETFNGLYRDEIGPIPSAMVDLAIFLRDHRENVTGPMFVETLDFLADVMANANATRATILSAYRTKKTNQMLASRIFGVAEKSQHLAGRALDITFDSKLKPAADFARRMARGGVGWYPQSHFIHLDSGPVRSWTIDMREGPAASHALASIKPKGPLTVRERLLLQRALAKRQLRQRTDIYLPAKPRKGR